jgi:hypothetical protein
MPTSTTITFTGLLVFHRDADSEEYEVGVLRARDAHEPHILQIQITPEGGTPSWIPPNDLERIIQDGNVHWELEVDGGSSLGIQAQPDKPGNRKNPQPGNDRDLGWIINLENDEFHKGPLKRTPNALQPIVRLARGELFTSCKTDSVVTIQGTFARDFGFIAGGISLKIDTSAGQQPVLRFKDQQGEMIDIFRLTQTNQVSYQVTIFNTPPVGTQIRENHFHLYYDRVFKAVGPNERFDLKLLYPVVSPPRDRCEETKEGLPLPTPNPFRCGGILVGGKAPLD